MPARTWVTVATVAAVAAACGGGGGPEQRLSAHRSARSTTTTSTTTTTLPPTTSTTAPFPGLRPGDSGPEVTSLQQQLAALHYDVPVVDGSYGPGTVQAVMAFQKVHGLGRDGVAGPETLARLAAPTTPAPSVPGGGGTRVEVDVARQVLLFYTGDALHRIVAVSTGSGERYCVRGRCASAVTPGGSFRVRGKVSGWQTGDLGRLYKPSYFNGNIAIHGALSVPGGPASHGCVRVPMSSADWIYAALGVGTPVYVLNGPKVPAPFGSAMPPLVPDRNQAPGDVVPTPAAAAPVTSTTQAPTTTSSTTTTTSLPVPPSPGP
ncbi:MAG: murein L,D-transpeptidase [Actinobacteria bacterium]|nr:murein L,D-transpeptidase [Actinomycetota bacterium]